MTLFELNTNQKEHGARKTPLLTVDIIIEILDWIPINSDVRKDGIVLIKRNNTPQGYALPGGFVDIGESTDAAAIREALEETGLHITQWNQFFTYSDPSRDPRGHTVSVVYHAYAIGTPRAGDDAKEAFIVSLDNVGSYHLCFDHKEIITDFLYYKQNNMLPR